MPRADLCVNSHNIKSHKGKNLRTLSNLISNEFPILPKDFKICGMCRKNVKITQVISSKDTKLPNNVSLEDNNDKEVNVFSGNESNETQDGLEPEIEMCKSTREIELEVLLTGLKEKFSSLELCYPLKLRILTIPSESWSARKIQKEFGSSRFLGQKAKCLRASRGVLASTTGKAVKTLSKSTVDKINTFYE